jgi:NO-binding membrane sensor protein with MHYT domain
MYDDPTATETFTDLSTLLWVVAAGVVLLAAYVAISHLRYALRAETARQRIACTAIAAAAIGTGVWSAMLLGLAGEGLPFALGFGVVRLGAAWAAATAAGAIALPLLVRWPRPAAVVAAGLVLAAGTLAAQALVVDAAGFKPGIEWRFDALAMAGPLVAGGCVGGFWVALLVGSRRRPLKRVWRWTAAALLAVALLTGQELVATAAALPTQSASAQAHGVPVQAASLLAAVIVPLALLLLQLDLRLRRAPRDQGMSSASWRRRRVRRGRALD